MPSFHTHPTELLLETGLCYRAPGGLAAGAGGRQEQAPSAMDSSSALAESARERPELGMTPPSKVPDGFIRRPKLRPIHFPEKYHSPPEHPPPPPNPSCFPSSFTPPPPDTVNTPVSYRFT
ncbi:hypothetical protein NQZ68_003568 [Dissostichus eleginoides]|nr:hypothetical protein NQZ68_003568 [Dissostichus eleginoides]